MPAAMFSAAPPADVASSKRMVPRGLRPEPEHRAQHRRLAGAVRADHRRDAPLGERQSMPNSTCFLP
jgi:hypothetical protein